MIVIRDITEQKRAGDELKARAMQQGAVLELGQLALTGIEGLTKTKLLKLVSSS